MLISADQGDAGLELSSEVALARIRQLSAHEVGHTLGLAHNFAASTYGDRASVMDYPAPRIKVTEAGQLDFSEAYGVGVGVWDRFCIRAMYAPLEEPASKHLNEMVQESIEKGWIYLSDGDARPASGVGSTRQFGGTTARIPSTHSNKHSRSAPLASRRSMNRCCCRVKRSVTFVATSRRCTFIIVTKSTRWSSTSAVSSMPTACAETRIRKRLTFPSPSRSAPSRCF